MPTQSPPNTQSRANAATLRNLHHMCLGSGHSPSPEGRADCMCLHGRSCVWLPFAAACCYTLFYLLMMPAARLVCQRPSNFPYFRTPLANFLLSRPNSVKYGNSKTTTLLPSAKCTRPLFQGQTSCGERPSGWHDIVTCQRLVLVCAFIVFIAVNCFMTVIGIDSLGSSSCQTKTAAVSKCVVKISCLFIVIHNKFIILPMQPEVTINLHYVLLYFLYFAIL